MEAMRESNSMCQNNRAFLYTSPGHIVSRNLKLGTGNRDIIAPSTHDIAPKFPGKQAVCVSY
jgi:hypothetical protein